MGNQRRGVEVEVAVGMQAESPPPTPPAKRSLP